VEGRVEGEGTGGEGMGREGKGEGSAETRRRGGVRMGMWGRRRGGDG
jgi:hypothetical protein